MSATRDEQGKAGDIDERTVESDGSGDRQRERQVREQAESDGSERSLRDELLRGRDGDLTAGQRVGVLLVFVALAALAGGGAHLLLEYTARNSLYVAGGVFVFLGWSWVREGARV